MAAHPRGHWPVGQFAAELGVGPDRLHAACTGPAGRAPQVILHDRLMLKAKRSLIDTALSVARIAFDLGFDDPACFSRLFAARAGTGPAAYRRRGRAQRPP